MNDNDKHIVKEKDGWYFWDEVGQDKYGPYKDIMNMDSLERQLMDSFKDIDTKEKEQKNAAQMMTKEEADHAQKTFPRECWGIKRKLLALFCIEQYKNTAGKTLIKKL